jgi:hypothetical protein
MAEFYVQNSLNSEKSVKFNITLRYFVTAQSRGDHQWVLEIGTTYSGADGNPISAKKVLPISVEDFDEAIESSVASMCSGIDWSPFAEDKEAPYVYAYLPVSSGVSIGSNMELVLKDLLPSAGIDLSAAKVTLNNSMVDFDITNEVQIEGDPYEYVIRWNPPGRVYSRYS